VYVKVTALLVPTTVVTVTSPFVDAGTMAEESSRIDGAFHWTKRTGLLAPWSFLTRMKPSPYTLPYRVTS
jgi:hypothetical protein